MTAPGAKGCWKPFKNSFPLSKLKGDAAVGPEICGVAAGPGIGCGQSNPEPKIRENRLFFGKNWKILDLGGNPPRPRAKTGTKLSGRQIESVCCTQIGKTPSHSGDILIYR